MNLLEQIKLEDLRGDQRELAELVGIDIYITLVKLCGGSDLYIAKADRLLHVFRNHEITAKFNGGNQKQLALEYGLSERTIREIIADTNCEQKCAVVERRHAP